MATDSDRIVNAWAIAMLTEGNLSAVVTDLDIREDTRSIPGTGCDTCDYGGQEEPWGISIFGMVDGVRTYKDWEGTMPSLLETLTQFSAMHAAMIAAKNG